MARKKNLNDTVEEQLAAMLASEEEPSEGRMKLIALGIKMIAVKAKLEESEYGDFFTESGSTAGNETGAKPNARKRTNGDATPA